MAADRCVLCGAPVSAGSQICRACIEKYGPVSVSDAERELRDIAQVLKITASTDRNIKESMEAILRIADRLGRNRNGR